MMTQWHPVAVALGGIALLVAACLLVGRLMLPGAYSPYRRRYSLLDAAQQSLAPLLRDVAGHLAICPRVPVTDLIEMRTPRAGVPRKDRTLLGQRVDFVLCDARTWEPRVVILLLEPTSPGKITPQDDQPASFWHFYSEQRTTAPPVARLLAAAGLAVVCVETGRPLPASAFQTTLRRALEAVSEKNRR